MDLLLPKPTVGIIGSSKADHTPELPHLHTSVAIS